MKTLLLIFTVSACLNSYAAPMQVIQRSDNQLEQAKSFSFSDKKNPENTRKQTRNANDRAQTGQKVVTLASENSGF